MEFISKIFIITKKKTKEELIQINHIINQIIIFLIIQTEQKVINKQITIKQ